MSWICSYGVVNCPTCRPSYAPRPYANPVKATKVAKRSGRTAITAAPPATALNTIPGREAALKEYNSAVPTEMRTYLNVPFALKDVVKAMGARWDADKRAWYADARQDTTKFDQWKPKPKPLWVKPKLVIVPSASDISFDDLMGAIKAAEQAQAPALPPAKPVELVMVNGVASKLSI